MAIFDTVHDKCHRVGMKNLYMSAKFAKAAYNNTNRVLIAVVTQKGMRCLPNAVIQDVNTPSAQMQVRGTVKVAVLKGDLECPSLIAASVTPSRSTSFHCQLNQLSG
jgi:ribonuclease HII